MATPPLHVTHVIPHIGTGGAELQLCRLVALAPRDRVRQEVLYYSDTLDQDAYRVYDDAGVDYRRVRRGRFGTPAFVWRLASEIRRRRPDILHCWLESATLYGRWSGLLAGAPHIVLSIRNTNIELWRILRLSYVVGGGRTRYLVNSGAVAAAVAARIGASPSRIAVIPNGIDVDGRPVPSARDALLAAHGCPPDTRIALTVARLTSNKNYPMLLRVAARCRGRLPVHFFAAGHGEEEGELRALAMRMGVGDTFHFLGLRHDVGALLRAADLFCFTSNHEGFPNALLEAMAAARPIVATSFPGHDELIDAGTNALVVRQDDDAAAFEALSRLLADIDLARRLGEAARQTAIARFGMMKMVESTLAYYEALVKEAP